MVKMNIFLTTMDNFAAVNEAYDEFFVAEPKPVSVPYSNLFARLLLVFLSDWEADIGRPMVSVSHLRGSLSVANGNRCRDRVHGPCLLTFSSYHSIMDRDG